MSNQWRLVFDPKARTFSIFSMENDWRLDGLAEYDLADLREMFSGLAVKCAHDFVPDSGKSPVTCAKCGSQ